MERPFVTIDLAPHLQDFLFHELRQNRKSGELMADGTHDIGRMIQSMVTVTDRPRKQEEKEFRILHAAVGLEADFESTFGGQRFQYHQSVAY